MLVSLIYFRSLRALQSSQSDVHRCHRASSHGKHYGTVKQIMSIRSGAGRGRHCPVLLRKKNGGWGRNRTGVDGFAGRCITTLPPSPGFSPKKTAPEIKSSEFPKRKNPEASPGLSQFSACPGPEPGDIWSGKRDSNSRHSRWQRDALPTELFPQYSFMLFRPP